MLTLTGKNTTAKVFTENIDDKQSVKLYKC